MKLGGARSIRSVVVIMLVVVVSGGIVARTYYGNANRSVDPRIVHARELYSGYDHLARIGDYYGIFALLDSIEAIYTSVFHYQKSFELGVLENNRAAALLTIALYRDSIPKSVNPYSELTTDSIISLAEVHVNHAINVYENWYHTFKELSGLQIRRKIEPGFMDGWNPSTENICEIYLDARVKEIESALKENDRRLSVCLTNLGLVFRYQGSYEKAARQYLKALDLWDRNLDAENNLNKLLNKPVKKRNLLQKLFPPERKNSD